MDRTAMVVDDDPVSLMLMCSFLEAQDWTILSAMSVAEAQEKIALQPKIDWLVLDDHLPDGSSEDILDYVDIYLTPQPWIVRVSGSEVPLPIGHAWHAFAPKPWSHETVDRLIHRWTRRFAGDDDPPQEMTVIDPELLPVFDAKACEKAFLKYPRLWFRVRDGVERRLPILLEDMNFSLARVDRPSIQHLAHEIRGMLKMLRSSSLAETARCLENDARWGRVDELQADLDRLESKLPMLQHELEAFDRYILGR